MDLFHDQPVVIHCLVEPHTFPTLYPICAYSKRQDKPALRLLFAQQHVFERSALSVVIHTLFPSLFNARPSPYSIWGATGYALSEYQNVSMYLGDDDDISIIGQQEAQNNIRYVLEFVLLSVNNPWLIPAICR